MRHIPVSHNFPSLLLCLSSLFKA